jgi:hypothetical protein
VDSLDLTVAPHPRFPVLARIPSAGGDVGSGGQEWEVGIKTYKILSYHFVPWVVLGEGEIVATILKQAQHQTRLKSLLSSSNSLPLFLFLKIHLLCHDCGYADDDDTCYKCSWSKTFCWILGALEGSNVYLQRVVSPMCVSFNDCVPAPNNFSANGKQSPCIYKLQQETMLLARIQSSASKSAA